MADSAFLWGVATSAYQIEGAADNDWTDWERRDRLKVRDERCGAGSGHRERWRSDFDLIPSVGANAYRLSIERSIIEPEPGFFSEEALAFERRRVDVLGRLGIEPVVTLHHYTHPRWFWAHDGWEDPGSVAAFRRYAAVVADALGPRVRVWVTLNEPIVFLLGGYLGGLIPPGRRSFAAAARALEHLLRAHTEAAAALKERIPGCRVGIAHNMLDFAPDRRTSAFDRRLAHAGERLYNLALLEGVAQGRLEWSFPGEGRVRIDARDLPGASDFVGVNYYSRVHIRFRGVPGAVGQFLYRDPESRGLTDTGWEIHPHGFDRVLRQAEQAGRPVLVTENGIATRNDGLRRDFLREHALVLAHRLAAGAPIQGYFYWSLLDNFEWLEGFRPRFGLFEVDYATYARRRRPSADLFAELGRQFTRGAGSRSSAAART
ncbi:MAG TPA: family 1 glycosylhydrolase [Thermoanaerobaculia bacterium]|nr:family 1 glycosylhydrolase [Thermoanaerobaculia bacterium]